MISEMENARSGSPNNTLNTRSLTRGNSAVPRPCAAERFPILGILFPILGKSKHHRGERWGSIRGKSGFGIRRGRCGVLSGMDRGASSSNLGEPNPRPSAFNFPVAVALRQWIAVVGAKSTYIEPGSPWENGHCESFNGKLRDELLNGEILCTLKEAKIMIEASRRHYNAIRPHSSLGYRPPAPEVTIWPATKPMAQMQSLH